MWRGSAGENNRRGAPFQRHPGGLRLGQEARQLAEQQATAETSAEREGTAGVR
jgi:hypothetical protein